MLYPAAGLFLGLVALVSLGALASTMNENTSTPNSPDTVAKSLGVPVDWLRALVKHESGQYGRVAVNPASRATGLIQWLPSSAVQLGLSGAIGPGGKDYKGKPADGIASILRLDDSAQYALIYRYFVAVRDGKWRSNGGKGNAYAARPLDSLQSLAMAVFYPNAWNWARDKEFPTDVQAQNPGVRTVGDYMKLVERHLS